MLHYRNVYKIKGTSQHHNSRESLPFVINWTSSIGLINKKILFFLQHLLHPKPTEKILDHEVQH